MAVTIGTNLGSYEITALLGKGGFGEVYRAKDKKLKREVAIKILPDEFSKDHDRLTRFQREAEVLASLNHPNIAAIYFRPHSAVVVRQDRPANRCHWRSGSLQLSRAISRRSPAGDLQGKRSCAHRTDLARQRRHLDPRSV